MTSLALLGSLGAQDNKDGWRTKAYVIDPERWTEAIDGLESSSNPAKALLERASITLTDGASAIYQKERKRLLTKAPLAVSEKIAAFLEKELQIVSPSVAVRLDCRWLSVPTDGEYPWLGPNVDHPGMSFEATLTQPQIEVVLNGLQADPAVDLLANPSALIKSGEPADIHVENGHGDFHLSALATLANDSYTMDLELSFEPPSTEPKVSTQVSIYDGSTVVFSSQADGRNFRLAIVTAQLIKADGVPLRAHHQPARKKAHTIVLDPGHGGKDRGGVVGGVQEKQLTLEFTRQVRRAFEDSGYKVVLTRQTDAFVPLAERSRIANDIDDALFVSLHFNSSSQVLIRGFEIFYPIPQTDEASESESMARFVQQALQESIGNDTPNRGIRQASFKVLRDTQHPAIMVEAAFLTNPKDLALVQDPAFLERLTEGIVSGVEAFDLKR